MKTWTTKDGRELEIKDMRTQHIKNCINMLKRFGVVSHATRLFYLTGPRPSGEFAQIAFEEELDKILDSPTSIHLDLLQEELERRQNLKKKEGKDEKDEN